MKKLFILGTLLASSAAFAGFNGQVAQQGGYTGSQNISTVAQVAKSPDDSWVVLEGKIVNQLGRKTYTFEDATGSIPVEISRKAWQGLNVGENERVRIAGEVDNDRFEKTKVEVKQIQKLN